VVDEDVYLVESVLQVGYAHGYRGTHGSDRQEALSDRPGLPCSRCAVNDVREGSAKDEHRGGENQPLDLLVLHALAWRKRKNREANATSPRTPTKNATTRALTRSPTPTPRSASSARATSMSETIRCRP
jgi:hypothetical protein